LANPSPVSLREILIKRFDSSNLAGPALHEAKLELDG